MCRRQKDFEGFPSLKPKRRRGGFWAKACPADCCLTGNVGRWSLNLENSMDFFRLSCGSISTHIVWELGRIPFKYIVAFLLSPASLKLRGLLARPPEGSKEHSTYGLHAIQKGVPKGTCVCTVLIFKSEDEQVPYGTSGSHQTPPATLQQKPSETQCK